MKIASNTETICNGKIVCSSSKPKSLTEPFSWNNKIGFWLISKSIIIEYVVIEATSGLETETIL